MVDIREGYEPLETNTYYLTIRRTGSGEQWIKYRAAFLAKNSPGAQRNFFRDPSFVGSIVTKDQQGFSAYSIKVNDIAVDDGTLTGINGYNVSAIIDANPNSGPNNTPFNLTLTFSSGGGFVNDIQVYNANAGNDWQFDQYSNYGFSKISQNVWKCSDRILTGVYGVERFYAVTTTGVKIAVGDVWLNGNPRAVPDWQNDGIGDSASRRLSKISSAIGSTSLINK